MEPFKKLNDIVYIITEIGDEIRIAKCRVTGIRIDDDCNYYYYLSNSRFAIWKNENYVYSKIDSLLDDLQSSIVS